MPLQIIRNDLTRMACDAVVNPTDEALSGSGGVDAQLHRAAGEKLDLACARIGYCAPGDAVLTKGYDLPADYIIHTVGPRWADGEHGERETLAACYRSALSIASKKPQSGHMQKDITRDGATHLLNIRVEMVPTMYVSRE